MYQSILDLFRTWLWENNFIYNYLLWLQSQENGNIIGLTLLCIVFIFLWAVFYNLLFIKYEIFKKDGDNKNKNWGDYIWEEWVKLFIIFIISIVIFSVILFNGFWIKVIAWIISWLSYDWVNYPGLAYFFWYDLESTWYQYYNTARYIVLIIVLLFLLSNISLYYTKWWDTKENKYSYLIWKSGTALILIVIIFFSTAFDSWMNSIRSIFWLPSTHESISNTTKI